MSSNMHKRSKHSGVTIAEYALAGALVLVVSIPILMNVSTDFNAVFQGLLGLINGHAVSADNYKQARQQQADLAQAALNGNLDAIIDTGYSGPRVDGNTTLGPPKAGTTRICMDGGFCLDLPATDSNAPAMTVGANGNDFISAYVQTLDDIAKQVNETPGMDDTLKQLVTNLANQGHGLANIQNNAENYFGADAGTRGSISGQLSGAQDNFWAAKGALDAFLNANPGALPTALKAVITSGAESTDQIVAVVRDKLTPLNYTTIKYRQVHDVYTGQTWNEQIGADGTSIPPTVELAEKLAEISANGICGSGGYRDRCTRELYQQDPNPPVVRTVTVTYTNGQAGQTSDRYLQQNKAKDLDIADQSQIVEYVTVNTEPASPPPAELTPEEQCLARRGRWAAGSSDSTDTCFENNGGGGF